MHPQTPLNQSEEHPIETVIAHPLDDVDDDIAFIH